MLRLARRSLAVTALLVTTLFAAGPAMAADPTASASASPSASADSSGSACLDQKAGYEASGACQLTVVQAVTECRGNVPWLDYSLEAEGTPNQTATLVWGDENGTHYTMTDLPLTGSVRWPGVEVDAQGEAIDWPGWTLVDGVWKEHDQWDWERPNVPLTFHVNPTATVTAYYPESSAPCAGPPKSQVLAAEDAVDGSAVLAETGSNDLGPLALAAGGLVVLGGLVLGTRAALRRRSATR